MLADGEGGGRRGTWVIWGKPLAPCGESPRGPQVQQETRQNERCGLGTASVPLVPQTLEDNSVPAVQNYRELWPPQGFPLLTEQTQEV